MPELPEVESLAVELRRRLPGSVISGVEQSRIFAAGKSGPLPTDQLIGKTFGPVSRKGKALALELRNGQREEAEAFLLWRLGMSGQLTLTSPDTPVAPHTHVRLFLDEGRRELRFRDVRRFGSVRRLTAEEMNAELARMGPDALEVGEREFVGSLRGRRGAIKSSLMNQRIVAGVGNIYADESLFLARIHPETAAGRIRRAKASALYRAMQEVLKKAVGRGGTSFRDYVNSEGRPGGYQSRLKVYGRAGRPCLRCGNPIRKIIVGGRGTHFCPRCQRKPKTIRQRKLHE